MLKNSHSSLRMVPPFVTLPTFCTSCFLRNLTTNTGIFVQFMNMCKKQIIARAIRIQKETWG